MTMRRASRVLLVVLVGLMTRATIARQNADNASPPTGVIAGVVVDALTGRAIPGAVVALSPAEATGEPAIGGFTNFRSAPSQAISADAGFIATVETAPPFRTRQVTDSQGRFAFVNVPASAGWAINASHAGYLTGGYSREDVPGASSQTIALTDGQRVTDARVVLWKPGAISGVLRDERGEPVVGVQVAAISVLRFAGRDRLASGPVALTDDRGAYRIPNLPPGRYLIAVPSVQSSISPFATQADLTGMSDDRYAAAQGTSRAPAIVPTIEAGGDTRIAIGRYPIPPPPSNGQAFSYPLTFYPVATDPTQATAIDLKFGEDRTAIDIQIQPAPVGALTGLVEGSGQIANLFVRLLAAPDLGLGFETATARTDTAGRFRLANVPAGSYTLEIQARLNAIQTWQPGSLTLGGLASSLPWPPGVGTFNGMFNRISGGPAGATFASLSSGGASLAGGTLSVTTDNAAALSAHQNVTVGAGATSTVVVRLTAAGSIAGRVEFENAAPAAAPPNAATPARMWSGAMLAADPADASVTRGQQSVSVNRNDAPARFTLTHLEPGQYLVRAIGPQGWMVKSVAYEGRDRTSQPFDISAGQHVDGIVVTLTQARATIAGTVTTANGAAAAGARIAAFPADSTRWTDFGFSPPDMVSATTSRDGTYRLSLPAGDYLVAIVPSAWRDRWRDPEFFAAAAGAPRVSVGWGETRTANLKVDAQ
jgi:uncharacterized protein (DUF2141 family)